MHRSKPGVFRNALSLPANAGFTLLELMVSFALLGIIVVLITGAMRLGIRSVDSGEKKIDTLDRLRTSFLIVTSQLQSEIPLAYDDDGEKKFYFTGDRESMRFSTNYSIWGGQQGYVVAEYQVTSDREGKKELDASEHMVGMEKTRETTLFTRCDAISFEYFHKDPAEETGEWVSEWTDDLNMPQKVKLLITYDGREISLIIPLRAPGTLSPGQIPAGQVPEPEE